MLHSEIEKRDEIIVQINTEQEDEEIIEELHGKLKLELEKNLETEIELKKATEENS